MSQQAEEQNVSGPRFISVFALGCGAGMRFRGALARQITDDIASALDRFETLNARPQHLIAVGEPGQVDPTLDEDEGGSQLDESGETPSLRFILFSTLPADSVVRSITQASGDDLALSGRMVIDGDQVDLALNLWDVGPPNLLWCRLLFGYMEDLPEMVANVVAHLAHRLEAPGALFLVAALAIARRSIGTRSDGALWAYSTVTDKIRRASLDEGFKLRHSEIAAGLVSVLDIDPDYEAPRLLLVEHALDRLGARDEAYASSLLRALDRLSERRMVYDLLRVEAAMVLGDKAQARSVLDHARVSWPEDPRVKLAIRRVEGG